MKFENTNAQASLSFTICKKTYEVEAGGEVDVDAAHVPYVYSRGLQLAPAQPKPRKPTPAPSPKVENAPTGGKAKDPTLPRVSG